MTKKRPPFRFLLVDYLDLGLKIYCKILLLDHTHPLYEAFEHTLSRLYYRGTHIVLRFCMRLVQVENDLIFCKLLPSQKL